MDTKANSCWNHGFVHHIIGIMMLGKEKPKHPTDPVVFYTQKKVFVELWCYPGVTVADFTIENGHRKS